MKGNEELGAMRSVAGATDVKKICCLPFLALGSSAWLTFSQYGVEFVIQYGLSSKAIDGAW